MRIENALITVMMLVLWAGWPVFGQEQEQEFVPAARQNDILRDYFRDQYNSFSTRSFEPNPNFVENYIDRQIDHFLREIEEDIQELKLAFREVADLHRRLHEPDSAIRRPLDRREFKKSLGRLNDKADDLKDRLALVFRGLDSKKEFPMQVEARDTPPFYEKELIFISDQIGKAELRIKEYLFLSTNTVKLDDLRGENMLVHLFWIQKMAEEIEDLIG